MSIRRKLLHTEPSAAAQLAAQSLERMEAAATSQERGYHERYPLSSLTPSPKNPRRKSLDRAGVSPTTINQLKIQSGETLQAWDDRCSEWLDNSDLDEKSKLVWQELFDLTISLLTGELIQPIRALPHGEILAGERRYTASLLGALQFTQVIVSNTPDNQQAKLRLIENIRRSDLDVSEIAVGVRQVMQDELGEPCGPDNSGLTIDRIMSVIGAGQTQSAYYRALCRLPENDEILVSISAGAFSSLRTAYESASKRLRQLKMESENPSPPNKSAGNNVANAKTKAPPKADSQKYPSFKSRIPGTEGGVRFLTAIQTIDGLSADASTAIANTLKTWEGAPDKARQKMLAKVLETVFETLDAVDPVDEQDSPAENVQ